MLLDKETHKPIQALLVSDAKSVLTLGPKEKTMRLITTSNEGKSAAEQLVTHAAVLITPFLLMLLYKKQCPYI